MITGITRHTEPLIREEVESLLTNIMNGDYVTPANDDIPVFKSRDTCFIFASGQLVIGTENEVANFILPYDNIRRIALEADEEGELYLYIRMRDGLRVTIDEGALSFTDEAAGQILED